MEALRAAVRALLEGVEVPLARAQHVRRPRPERAWIDPGAARRRQRAGRPDRCAGCLPDRVLDLFCDDSAFGEWRSVAKAIGVSLEGDSILGLRQPLSLGGTMTAGNLVVADLFEYYESTAEVLANLR
ncbi:MAG: hypothetical protein ACXWP4_07585 [Polyangiales bacterium]